MTWVTWRQHRGEALVVGAALVLLGALLIYLGRDMYAAFQQLGVGDCLAHPDHPNCSQIVESFRAQYGVWEATIPWLNFAPAVLAMLVGAPLVARELEHGTQRLVWTQSVTRGRWIAVKLGAVLAGGLVVAGLLIALFTWWRWPFDQLDGRLQPAGFDFEGIVLAGYVAFSLSLAIAAGTLLRRTIPAMAATLGGFVVVRLPMEFILRPMYQPALTLINSPNQTSATIGQTDWVVARGWLDSLGNHLSDAQVFGACIPQNPNAVGVTKNAVFDCIASHGWRQYVSYQPADRFWTFQAIETSIYAALAVALLALTIWWVRQRIA
jgi:hypothetical protein